ncbi:MAG: cache domain-containing protein [Oligoflexia bacterium]|nr:cache domain-containing protein [Oligoflexia bacterium]
MIIEKKRSLFKLIFPAILAIILFNLTIFGIFLPKTKNIIIERKKEMIKELTLAAWSELSYYHKYEINGELTRQEAQQRAIRQIQHMRYGDAAKDYFWISDKNAKMIMHPYRNDLNGLDLSNFSDQSGKKPFVEFAKVVQENGEGHVEYIWQWKDKKEILIPKISYVKGFAPWGWIIGTGIYLDDIKEEIAEITNALIIISLIISIIITLLLYFLLRQVIRVERERIKSQQNLQASEERYRLLVEASEEGMILMIEGKIVYANKTILNMSGYSLSELTLFHLDQIISTNVKTLVSLGNTHCFLKRKNLDDLPIIYNISEIPGVEGEWLLISVKNLASEDFKSRNEILKLASDMQSLLAHAHFSVKDMVSNLIVCNPNTTLKEAILKIKNEHSIANVNVLLVYSEEYGILGTVNIRDILLKAVVDGKWDPFVPISKIMNAPVTTIDEKALWFEAHNLLLENKIDYAIVINEKEQPTGIIKAWDLLARQSHPLKYLTEEMKCAQSEEKLLLVQQNVPSFIRIWSESGAKTQVMEQIISNISDLFLIKAIELTINRLGIPPVAFSFVIMGSQARGEQTLFSDQDHGIIFDYIHTKDNEGIKKQEEVSKYFLELGARISNILEQRGQKQCAGQVMSGQLKWCKSKDEWQDYLNKCADGESVNYFNEVSIFLDMRSIYGDATFVHELIRNFYCKINGNQRFLYNYTETILSSKPPINFFGIEFIEKKSLKQMVDIKSAILPLVALIKLFSMVNNIFEVNSFRRLQLLKQKGVISNTTADELILSLEFLGQLKIKHELKCIEVGVKPDHLINFAELTELEQTLFKKVLADIVVFRNRAALTFTKKL